MKDNYKKYKALDQKVDELCESEKYEEAIELLEKSYVLFPEYYFELSSYTLWCYKDIKKYEKCLDLLKEATNKGYFYGLKWKTWDPLRNYSLWNEIEKKNEENRAIVLASSKMEYKVYTPDGYNKDKTYPLFFILHGNTDNIDRFKKEWKPDFLLKNQFIVAYIQSSNPAETSYFEWTSDYKRSRNNILDCYNILCHDYSIDKTKVILGGFSGGCMASLNAVMNNTIPVQGIVALCPLETDDCNDENFKNVAKRGTKLVLLEGEKSGEVPFHLELMKSAKKHNLPAMYIINNDASHNIPDNWDAVVRKSIEFIRGKNFELCN